MYTNSLNDSQIRNILEIVTTQICYSKAEGRELPNHISIEGPFDLKKPYDFIDGRFNGEKYIGQVRFYREVETTTVEVGIGFFADAEKDLNKGAYCMYYTLNKFDPAFWSITEPDDF